MPVRKLQEHPLFLSILLGCISTRSLRKYDIKVTNLHTLVPDSLEYVFRNSRGSSCGAECGSATVTANRRLKDEVTAAFPNETP